VKKQRAHLRTRTTALLYLLQEQGPGGATAETLAKAAGMRTRSAAQRLRWLQRGKLVRYVQDGALWQLTDDSIFKASQ
jgi:DNA-binding IclR family transcriptional regulator